MDKSNELIDRILVDPKINLKIKENIIKGLDKNNINNICELVLNVLNKNIPITQESFKKLVPQAKYCRKILDKNLKIKVKRKINTINQLLNLRKGSIQKKDENFCTWKLRRKRR